MSNVTVEQQDELHDFLRAGGTPETTYQPMSRRERREMERLAEARSTGEAPANHESVAAPVETSTDGDDALLVLMGLHESEDADVTEDEPVPHAAQEPEDNHVDVFDDFTYDRTPEDVHHHEETHGDPRFLSIPEFAPDEDEAEEDFLPPVDEDVPAHGAHVEEDRHSEEAAVGPDADPAHVNEPETAALPHVDADFDPEDEAFDEDEQQEPEVNHIDLSHEERQLKAGLFAPKQDKLDAREEKAAVKRLNDLRDKIGQALALEQELRGRIDDLRDEEDVKLTLKEARAELEAVRDTLDRESVQV